MHLNLSADDVLSTTRAVRKRLDFDRPVEREVILECLELAVQAPTGSNSQGWQWIFVEDAAKKKALADIYAENFAIYRQLGASNPMPSDDPRAAQQERVISSAEYLTENFHRVPVLWNLHRKHHEPAVLTPFTAFRFWPLEQIVHQPLW